LSESEYLKLERTARERHQYLDGESFAMAGESWEHGSISVNIVRSLGNQLEDGPCRVQVKDLKVRSGPLPKSTKRPAGLYSYPDIVVVCDEPKFLDEYRDVLLNPSAIIEILSDETEAFDRGKKFTRYQQYNPSLTDYVLVSQEQPLIEHFHREKNGTWTYQSHEGLNAIVKLPSIKCRLEAADVYKGIKFARERSE
jgi:Uma2 family endonuclease